MEMEKIMDSSTVSSNKEERQNDDVPLPGFRFHPTDEELVGFYLRRKVEKRPISIELIKQADIYKYDPWDLPKSSNVGDKEWYFFCKRGRKYRNSIRPNRVTGSGFWKATGIDRPIYSSTGTGDCIIGLKKSLVYYRGSAGKGTKTDWMMHEFRLPLTNDKTSARNNMDTKTIAQEAEVWTLCRILKRNTSNYKKNMPDWRELSAAANKKNTFINPNVDSSDQKMQSSYITFNAPIIKQNDQKPYFGYVDHQSTTNQQFTGHFSTSSSVISQVPSTASSLSSSISADLNELFLRHADWEDLRSIVDCAASATATNPFYL